MRCNRTSLIEATYGKARKRDMKYGSVRHRTGEMMIWGDEARKN